MGLATCMEPSQWYPMPATSPNVVPITAVRQTTVFWGVPATDRARATVVVDGRPDCGFTEINWLPQPGQQTDSPKGFVFPHGLLHSNFVHAYLVQRKRCIWTS